MARKLHTFISFQHKDVMQARGLRLMNANPNHKVSFVERSFIDPLKDKTSAQIRNAVKNEIQASDAVLVLVSGHTKESTWVPLEVEMARDAGVGVTAMKLPGHDGVQPPSFLEEAAVQTHDWDPSRLNEHITRAAKEGKALQSSTSAPIGRGGC